MLFAGFGNLVGLTIDSPKCTIAPESLKNDLNKVTEAMVIRGQIEFAL